MPKHDYVGDPWIGVDLDGTLAYYDKWRGYGYIGRPIVPMVNKVKSWLAEGKIVKIFTARVASIADPADVYTTQEAIKSWCEKHIGQELEITAEKDWGMIELYDDRCIQVMTNKGVIIPRNLPSEVFNPGLGDELK